MPNGSKMKYKSGALLSPADERDYKISAAMEIPAGASSTSDLELPDEYEVWTSYPDDQQATSMCVAYSLAGICESVEHQMGLDMRDYSAAYIYGNRKNDMWKHEGMILRTACNTVVDFGDVYRSVWDTTVDVPGVIELFNKKYSELNQYAERPFSKYVNLSTFDDVRAFIYKYNIPVLVCIKTSTIDRGAEGNHALMAYGWTKNGELKCQNSWGSYKAKPVIPFHKILEKWGLVPNEIFFSDIGPDDWGFNELHLAAQKGIILGYPDGSFKPDQTITRQEMAVICGRLLKEIKKSFKE